MKNVHSKASLVRQGKLKRHDCSEENAMAAKTSVSRRHSRVFTTSRTHR